ncbi:hypothetical protein BpHYR1_029216 [Brachionus plicatilis]|uniref:Uncharacterized protein n=1 Tax=Brachionus plicatilis TaxID=10195 RepID=A0A3M7S3X2_BRAPC|nr:hypothetical protein BpHYR1_029216 [Brachionus plicatilis]
MEHNISVKANLHRFCTSYSKTDSNDYFLAYKLEFYSKYLDKNVRIYELLIWIQSVFSGIANICSIIMEKIATFDRIINGFSQRMFSMFILSFKIPIFLHEKINKFVIIFQSVKFITSFRLDYFNTEFYHVLNIEKNT